MTGYNLEFTDKAKEDISALKKSEPPAFRKIENIDLFTQSTTRK
jgi:hypothetical protein